MSFSAAKRLAYGPVWCAYLLPALAVYGTSAGEESVANVIYQYEGRLDRRIRINGREGILDIKGPFQASWQAIQLSLYQGCFAHPLARWTLHLSDDRYQLIEHKGREDWAVAKAAITIAAWKERNGD